MQKIVIKKPWGVEIKDYKTGDPIPAGVKFKIFDAKDTDKIEAYADSLDESADYQKKRFKEPYYMYESKKTIKEGRIAKGYENLNPEERAKHLLSHPTSKYMNDLKSENITERAIRKAVKEMLGQPAKDDPQFITDVNEGCIKESAYYIKSPHGFYVMKTDNSYDLTDDKEKALKYTIGNDAAKELAYIHRYSSDSRLKKLMVVQEEGEAPAVATSTANVANPELPLKMEESLSSKTHKFKPEELKVGKRVIDKVGGREVHGKITVNHHDLYKDNPYTQDKKGSTVVTIVTDSGRSYDVDANDNGGEFILEGCSKKKKVAEDKEVPIWTLKKGDKFRVTYDTNIHKAGEQLFKVTNVSDKQVDAISDDNVPYYWTNMTTKVIKESCKKKKVAEDVEDSYKYQTSVAGGMGTDAENAESAKEYEDETLLIREHKSFRKFLKESAGQKLNITLIRKPSNMKEVESEMRKGHGDRVKAIVDKSYKLSENEYDKFVYNFNVHTTYLSGEGGVDSDGTVHVVEITAPARKTIYVDPEGYDYARYVGW